MSPFEPPARAFSQLDDPAFLRVVGQSLLWAVAAFAALIVLTTWGTQHLVAQISHARWLGWLAGLLGGAGAAISALYLFLPAATVIATMFVNSVSAAVERRFYPGLPQPQPALLSEQVWDGLELGTRVLVLQAVGLVLAVFLPGVGALIGWAIAAWAIGRGLFVAIAMRRMDRASATRLYEHLRVPVLIQGALIAAGGLVPVLNLAVPVLGTAALVHVLHLAAATDWEVSPRAERRGRLFGRRDPC